MLFRFRSKKFGVIADIRKAFLQIGLNSRDRDFLKFLWYDIENQNLRTFRHARVVFGITCSPFLLGAVIEYHLQNLLSNKASPFSKDVIEKLRKAFYVDNVVTSVDTEENLHTFIEESTNILLEGKFELRGWEYTLLKNNTNITALLSPLLGLVWNRNLDVLQASLEGLNSFSIEKITKRKILSAAHKLFDPIGFTNPVALFPKILLQEIWALKLGWDSEVDEKIKSDFISWFKELSYLAQVQIPRWFFNSQDSQNSSLHVFCDASKHAYATAVFLRSESNDGIFVTLVQAKSRVAPLKKMTIPRLELLAATIGTRLSVGIRKEIDTNIKTYFWTDSSTVLSWIKREDQWKPFVWNRIEEIRRDSDKNDWFHVAGEKNPADLPSRGCFGKKLADERWWEGPAWLRESTSEWNNQYYDCDEEIINAERKKIITSCFSGDIRNFKWYYNYYSNYNKIVRLVAWIKRFINTSKKKQIESEDLTLIELNCAEKQIIKLIQEESFPRAVDDPKLSTLCPFKDEEGILRIRTKISDRDDSRDFRYPYILPAKHEVVNRLIASVHLKNCHAGVQCLITILRERFWILKCRRTVKSVVNRCHVCRRYSSRHLDSAPIQLPKNRVQDAKIFQIVGVDLAGPLYVKSGEKVWITIYTCAVYRAIHLEVVSSLSTIVFLQSLRRFIARRGRPSTIYSDNGSNFVGAVNALQKIDWQEISKESTIEKIEWKFNPPTAAWWGGWWERLIRLVKDILRKILGKAHLSMDELNTILCECEALINSRPLTPVTEDNLDLATLTPKMFLQETIQTDALDISRVVGEDLRRRFKYKETLLEDLKRRFRAEYLGQLKLYSKKRSKRNVNIGDIVFVLNNKQKRMDWILGRVLRILPSRDGEVRVVELKTMNGVLVRPVQNICPLEMEEQHICPLEMEECRTNTNGDTDDNNLETYNETKLEEKSEEQDDFPRTRCGRKVKLPQRFQC